MTADADVELDAIDRDRELAWELFEAQPQHPRIAQLTQSVLARAPEFTGMIILLAMHREACGETDEARRLLRELVARRDHQFIGAVRRLRDLEYADGNYADALRLADVVLREDPEAGWLDRMEFASATAMVTDLETGWRQIDEAVEFCGRTDPDGYAYALGQRALRFLALGTPPDRFLSAAQQAIEADPSESIIAVALAYAYLYDYRPDEATVILRRVLREDPTDELAHAGMIVAKAFLDPLEHTEYTMDDLRNAGMGEIAWRVLRDKLFETGLGEALAALDTVMPAELVASLRPPLDREAARASGGEAVLLAWHDGQAPGTGELWRDGTSFRLMTADEIREMDDAIEREPEAWPQWDAEGAYFTQIFTDDAGSYVIEGPGGHLFLRPPEGQDQQIAASFSDWVWDRVVAFGGEDPRPGAGAASTTRTDSVRDRVP